MKIRITIRHEEEPKGHQLQVDSEQRISTTLRVLKETLPSFPNIREGEIIRVAENGRRIDTEKTYEDAHIYTGASLIVY